LNRTTGRVQHLVPAPDDRPVVAHRVTSAGTFWLIASGETFRSFLLKRGGTPKCLTPFT